MSKSKLQNIKALKQMLDGTHRTQTRKTIGFSDANSTANKNKKREVGETWTEVNANGNTEWVTQKEGYRVRSSVNPELSAFLDKVREDQRKFPNCQKQATGGECTCKKPNHLDEKFRRIAGMCHDCLVQFETKLKINGKFDQYALNKMKANAESFFIQADKEVEILKLALNDLNFVNSERGDIENWEFEGKEEYKQKIDQHYKEFKEKTLEKFNKTEM